MLAKEQLFTRKSRRRQLLQYAATETVRILIAHLKLIELTSGEKMYWHLILK
jgi:hypothetical protein